VTFLEAIFTHALFYDVFFKGKATFREAQMHKVKFYSVEFQGKALFLNAQFLENTEFNHTTFGHAVFTGAIFKGKTKFNHVVFAGGEKTFFDELKDNNDLSKVSFMNSDITRIRFSDKINWGGNDGFTIIEERRLREELEKIKEKKIDSKPMEEGNNESQFIFPFP
jgi:uncharacterized protein YjbI with pentapeptide repeats